MTYKVIHTTKEIANSNTARNVNGEWIPARPYRISWISEARNRFQAAWGVLIGRYDALDWEQK